MPKIDVINTCGSQTSPYDSGKMADLRYTVQSVS